MLTKEQFRILSALEAAERPLSPSENASEADLDPATAGRIVSNLTDAGYVRDGKITKAGLAALEPYRVRRAVFLAAGFGSRMVPITLNTPKPLVRVNGKRLIDTLLDAVIAAGIDEIYLVRGYLGEQFDQLLYKYPNLRFIDNPFFSEANSISSAFCAREHLRNAYMCEADLLLKNPAIFPKYQYRSNVLGEAVGSTDDWCLTAENGLVRSFRVGGFDCYREFGVTYWTAEDGAKLKNHLEEVFLRTPEGKQRCWDQVALDFYLPEYEIEVRECTSDDICEIDTFAELQRIDEKYRIN